jgi:hypothetical protein
MNLLVHAIMAQIGAIAVAKGFEGARVLSKVNRHGELVIALLIPPRTPGEWEPEGLQARELKRQSRQQRS